MAQHFLTIGQQVNDSGYIGTVMSFYSDAMVCVRLASGVVCVDFRDLKNIETGEFYGR